MREPARWLRFHVCRKQPLVREGLSLVCKNARYQRAEALAMDFLPFEEGD